MERNTVHPVIRSNRILIHSRSSGRGEALTTTLDRFRRTTRRRNRRNANTHQRLDIQGLRMVAILTVFANHLIGWPQGGFVGVDVFFVISGFLITGNLLRDAGTFGNVSFRRFYWNRVRRIVPAATVVLIITYVVATILYLPFRSNQIGIDALWAFAFLANWHFASTDTDYFTAAADVVSPVRHYWSLSIEEQFYFVWPALIFAIGLLVLGRGWSHGRRMLIAGGVMTAIVAASLAWAIYETAVSPAWSYFSTFSRVWELGVGALLATSAGVLARLPDRLRPVVSWIGVSLIVISVVVIREGAAGFPAPWGLLPVTGSALVIAAGIGKEPRYQPLLRNPLSTYIGNISYSLYLVHWPVIVFLGLLMDAGWRFYITALLISVGLAIASYHLIENPLRRADLSAVRSAWAAVRSRQIEAQPATGYAALGASALLVAGLAVYAGQPPQFHFAASPPSAITQSVSQKSDPSLPRQGPLTTVLQTEIAEALQATHWPDLNPSIDEVINDPTATNLNVNVCSETVVPDPTNCRWGPPSAPLRAILVGDSTAKAYLAPLRDLAEKGELQVYLAAMPGCIFTDEVIKQEDQQFFEMCPGRKQAVLDYLRSSRPNIVIISNRYSSMSIADTGRVITPGEWATAMQRMADLVRPSVDKIVWLAPPPGDANIRECYASRGATPADCIGEVDARWNEIADMEQQVARSSGGVWIDSRPWFCAANGYCPSFVSNVPTKSDALHLLPAYGTKIAPVIGESLRESGILPTR